MVKDAERKGEMGGEWLGEVKPIGRMSLPSLDTPSPSPLPNCEKKTGKKGKLGSGKGREGKGDNRNRQGRSKGKEATGRRGFKGKKGGEGTTEDEREGKEEDRMKGRERRSGRG